MNETTKTVAGEAGLVNYNEVVSKLRVLARDEMRLDKTNRVRAEIFILESQLKDLNDTKTNYTKRLACVNYDLSKVDSLDPRAEDLKEGFNNNIKSINEMLLEIDKEIVDLNKVLTDRNAKILDVQNGVWKASIDAINDKVATMISTYTKTAVSKLV